ncbi:MAG: hypothetical protein WCH74_09530, partial [Chloroflexota bacterium]
TQAWRQPGSSFKPFIYSAALEKGFTPSTIINDAPLFFDAGGAKSTRVTVAFDMRLHASIATGEGGAGVGVKDGGGSGE